MSIKQQLFKLVKNFIQKGGQWTWYGMRLAAVPLKSGSYYKRMLDEHFLCSHPKRKDIKALQNRVKGLHALLPDNKNYSYSIIIPVYKPDPKYLKIALESALNQSAPNMEVLVGFDGPQPEKVYEVVNLLQKQFPGLLKSYQMNRGGISKTTNTLVHEAKNAYLLLMDHDDWIRPDLLYRYEQTLRQESKQMNTVLYCDEYKINEKDFPIFFSQVRKPKKPAFPYLFHNYICHCLLVPKILWDKVGGLRPETDGAQDFDLVLRLDAIEAEFQNVPCFLYAWRAHAQSTAQNAAQKDYVTTASLRALSNYAAIKKLDWEISIGFPALDQKPAVYRASPKCIHQQVHAFIPFKDQKEMTLRAIESLQKQKGIRVKITAVNNNSVDSTIIDELVDRGVEVLNIYEPFNYSRINNIAVRRTAKNSPDDILLFMNNDVELKEDALLEMCRWIDQPGIGMVGCRLNYPDGRLQHGGVNLCDDMHLGYMPWYEYDKHKPFHKLSQARHIQVCDAVTAACSIIKRKNFEELGGFDEVWYPIAYSDTDLCLRLKKKGLYCLYTPYAEGVHYESATRASSYEDFEGSKWLSDRLQR